jgi:RING-like zinc finger
VTLHWNETAREYQEEENNSSINNNTQGNLRHLLLHRPQPPQSRNEQDDKQQQQEQQQLRSWNDMDLSSLQEAIHPAATTTSRIYGGGINTAWNTTKAVENDASTATKGENEAALLRRPRTIEVRICPCAESHPAYPDYKYYCPTDRAYCAVPGVYPSSGSTYAAVTPVCLNLQNDEIFVRSVWPIILIWFALAAVFCLCTYPGRNAIDYVLATCFPCYNKRVVDSILQSHQSNNNNSDLSPVSRHAYQRRRHLEERYLYLVRDHQVVDGGLELAERRLFEYQLKTKRYHRIPAAAPKDDNDDGENAIVAAPSELGPVATNAETTSTSTAIANSASNAEEMTCQPIDAPLPVVSSSPSGSLLVDNDNNNNNNDDSNNNDEGEADDELDEHACSICFVPLEDGDRVGALPCQHVFHVGKSRKSIRLHFIFVAFSKCFSCLHSFSYLQILMLDDSIFGNAYRLFKGLVKTKKCMPALYAGQYCYAAGAAHQHGVSNHHGSCATGSIEKAKRRYCFVEIKRLSEQV